MYATQSSVPRRPVVLIIMDGVGHNPSPKHNAVLLAKTPKLDELYSKYPMTVLEASGKPVGLPDGQMGNSEVGHITLGSGQIIKQDLVRISDSIADGDFSRNPLLCKALDRLSKSKGCLHLIGLVSDGGIHSHLDHLLALIDAAKQAGVRPLLHMITDGRDTAPNCATRFLQPLEQQLADANGCIATVCGRYYAMDRDNRWDRVKIAWDMIVHGKGRDAASAQEAIESAWSLEEGDEFINPVILPGYEKPGDSDEFLFFNFRNDRTRELTEALTQTNFEGFVRGEGFMPFVMTTMTEYLDAFNLPVMFEKEVPKVTLAEIISDAGIKQFHSAETEKYPHVTFFFNGGREKPYPGEDRKLVDSPSVSTYDLKPEMSAYPLRDALVEAIQSHEYGFIVCNFANGDMVGHTGVRPAVIKAMEVLDDVVGTVVEQATEHGYSVVLTADHGNADLMVDPLTGDAHTQHTNFPVACMVADSHYWRLLTGAGLPSIAPTVLQLMGLPQPTEMSGQSLLLDKLD